MRTLQGLLLLLGAALSISVASCQLTIKVEAPKSFDLVSRFIETIYHEKPDAFYPFIRQLTQFQVRPKVTFSDPAFQSSKSLDGKTRPSKYANHNPIFTLLAQPYESYQALESTFIRSRLWKDRGSILTWKMALANDVALPTLEEMEEVAEAREAELRESRKGEAKECQSWIDVAGKKVCTGEEFWKIAGVKQIFSRGPIALDGFSPATHSFDRFLPNTRNESLPLVVLYAAPTDEKFPALFDFLHNLASPKTGQPRLQFALRWKMNKDAPATSYLNQFDVQAIVEGQEAVKSVEDLSLKVATFIDQSSDKLEALVKVAKSLPQLHNELSSTAVPEALNSAVDAVKENNFVRLNGVKISNEEGINSQDLMQAMRTDGYLLNQIASIIRADEKLARSILANATVTWEEPKENSKGPVLPTKERPLEFVNLVEATQGLGTVLTRSSYLEGVTDDSNDVDPPALATVLIIADLDSSQGLKQVEQGLKFLETASEVRAAFLHRPSPTSDSSSKSPYAFSSLLACLASSRKLAEVYPSELREFLSMKIGPNGPKRSLDDIWTADNPITPFLEGGLQDEEAAKRYFEDIETFASRIGIPSNENAVVINGRIIRLGSDLITSSTLNNLVQYELKRRIRPVVEAALPSLPDKIKDERLLQAELYDLATSVIASSQIKNRQSRLVLPASMPSFELPGAAKTPMFEITAVLDPVSSFARKVIPILLTLSKEPLFKVDIYLVPTSTTPTSEELRISYGTAFDTKLNFDEDTLQEIESVVVFDGLEKGSTVDVTVGGESKRVVIDGSKQELLFGKSIREAVQSKEGEHIRDEL